MSSGRRVAKTAWEVVRQKLCVLRHDSAVARFALSGQQFYDCCSMSSALPTSSTLWLCRFPKLTLALQGWYVMMSAWCKYTCSILNIWHLQMLPIMQLLGSQYQIAKVVLGRGKHGLSGKCCYHREKILSGNITATPSIVKEIMAESFWLLLRTYLCVCVCVCVSLCAAAVILVHWAC